ncbi:PTS operon transcription antiterminator [Clostridioides difficile]|nr:PTS operon transcription antiterminator [Clostridioides difficile]
MVVDKEIVSILQILLNSTLITTNGLQEESNSQRDKLLIE